MHDLELVELGTVEAGEHQLTIRAHRGEDPASPVMIMLPAMGVPARYYQPFLRSLVARGLTVVSFDLRGQGEALPRARRGIRFGYQDLIDDAGAVVDLVERNFPQAPRFLLGHSLGGQVALLYAASHPDRVHGVTLLGSGSVWFRSFRGSRAWKNLFGTQVVAAFSAVLGCWPGERLGFGGRQPAGVMRDWARQGRSGRYRLGGSDTDYEAALATSDVPLLTVTMDGDELAPESSVDHLAGKAVRSARTARHYSCEIAGASKLGHYAWVYSSGELARWIGEWAAAAAAEPVAESG